MTDETRKSLTDIAEACREIRRITDGLDAETFAADVVIRAAVERHFLIAGEAARRLRKTDRATFDSTKHFKEAVKHRNFLIHVYDLVLPEKLWQTVRDSLPELLAHVDALLDQS